jgi:signal transduction histidine kinase
MRTRIATDLHDDIGANLTRISLLSEVAGRHQNGGNGKMLRSIAEIARESVASMNDIVWAVSPDHDSLHDLVSRMRRHAQEVTSASGISLAFKSEIGESETRLDLSERRDLLLIFKEAVNNAVRHADATNLKIVLNMEGPDLLLRIADNGKGFDPDVDHEGQGLRSMRARARELGGKFKIEAAVGSGTIVTLNIRL